MDNKMEYSHIYSFVDRKFGLPLTKRLFYEGCSQEMEMRTDFHISAIFGEMSEENKRFQEVYSYLNNFVGVNNFDIYIIDHVPTNLKFTYERIYYNLLSNQGYELANCNKPIPENFEMTQDDEVVSQALEKLDAFKERLVKSQMTPEEKILNELKKKCIQINKAKYGNPQKPEIDKLKTQNMELRKLVQTLNATNTQLLEENTRLKEMTDIFKYNLELQKKVMEVNEKVEELSVTGKIQDYEKILEIKKKEEKLDNPVIQQQLEQINNCDGKYCAINSKQIPINEVIELTDNCQAVHLGALRIIAYNDYYKSRRFIDDNVQKKLDNNEWHFNKNEPYGGILHLRLHNNGEKLYEDLCNYVSNLNNYKEYVVISDVYPLPILKNSMSSDNYKYYLKTFTDKVVKYIVCKTQMDDTTSVVTITNENKPIRNRKKITSDKHLKLLQTLIKCESGMSLGEIHNELKKTYETYTKDHCSIDMGRLCKKGYVTGNKEKIENKFDKKSYVFVYKISKKNKESLIADKQPIQFD